MTGSQAGQLDEKSADYFLPGLTLLYQQVSASVHSHYFAYLVLLIQLNLVKKSRKTGVLFETLKAAVFMCAMENYDTVQLSKIRGGWL